MNYILSLDFPFSWYNQYGNTYVLLNFLTSLLSWFASGLVGSNAIIFPLPLLGDFWYRDILHHDFKDKLFTLKNSQNQTKSYNFISLYLFSWKHFFTFYILETIYTSKSRKIYIWICTHSHNFEVHLQKKIVDVKEMLLFPSRTRQVVFHNLTTF